MVLRPFLRPYELSTTLFALVPSVLIDLVQLDYLRFPEDHRSAAKPRRPKLRVNFWSLLWHDKFANCTERMSALNVGTIPEMYRPVIQTRYNFCSYESWIDESVIDRLLENFIKEMSSSLLECSTISIVEDYVSVGIFLWTDLLILDKSATQWEHIRRILFWPTLQLRQNF